LCFTSLPLLMYDEGSIVVEEVVVPFTLKTKVAV
jgi:hypothetical protein